MHEMQAIVTNVCGVCLSGGSTWLHCAKTAEWIKRLNGLNILGSQRNIVLVLIPHSEGEGDSMQTSPNYFGLLLFV